MDEYIDSKYIKKSKSLLYYLLISLGIFFIVWIIIILGIYVYNNYIYKNIKEYKCKDDIDSICHPKKISDEIILPTTWQICVDRSGETIDSTGSMYIDMNDIESNKMDTSDFNVFKLNSEECSLLNEVNEFDMYDSFKLMEVWREMNLLKSEIESIMVHIINNNIPWNQVYQYNIDNKLDTDSNIHRVVNSIKLLGTRFIKLLDILIHLNDIDTHLQQLHYLMQVL